MQKREGVRRLHRFDVLIIAFLFLITIFPSLSSQNASAVSAANCKILAKDTVTHQREGWPRDLEALQSAGAPKILIVAVDFPDAPAGGNADTYINKKIDLASLKGFFDHNSGGVFSPEFITVPDFVHMPLSSDQYGSSQTQTLLVNNEWQDHVITRTALAALADTVRISDYQAAIVIVTGGKALSGYVALSTSQDAGSIITKTGEIHNTILIGDGALNSTITPAWRVMIHEVFHLLGLSDLYLYQPDGWYLGKSTGLYGQMSYFQSSETEALDWNLWLLGWIKDSQIKCYEGIPSLRSLPLNSEVIAEDVIRIAVFKLSPTKVLVVEPIGPNAIDLNLEKGLLAYTVDSTIPTGFGPVSIISKKTPLSSAPISPTIPDWIRLQDAPLKQGEYLSIENKLFVNSAKAGDTPQLSVYTGSSVATAIKKLDEATSNITKKASKIPKTPPSAKTLRAKEVFKNLDTRPKFLMWQTCSQGSATLELFTKGLMCEDVLKNYLSN